MFRALICCLCLALQAFAGPALARAPVNDRALIAYIEQGQITQLRAALPPRATNVSQAIRSRLMVAAIEKKQPEAIKTLVEWGIGANDTLSVRVHTETVHITPLMLALSAKAGLPTVAQLLDSGADANQQAGSLLPLNFALSTRQHEIAQLLLDRGARSDRPDAVQGLTSLMDLAVGSKDVDDQTLTQLTRRLVQSGAQVNARSEGTTALHLAVRVGNPTMVRLLLELGAEPNPNNRQGQTPLHIAEQLKRPDLVALLSAFGAKP
jgi:hypothetical protein